MIQWKEYWKYNVGFLFNKESDYSEENKCKNEVFHSTILQPIQFEPEQKKNESNKSHEKETKHIHASVADLLHIRIRNLDCSAKEASRHPAFMGICPTISHTC